MKQKLLTGELSALVSKPEPTEERFPRPKMMPIPPNGLQHHDDPIVELHEETSRKIEDTMQHITSAPNWVAAIESILTAMSETEKYAFLIGFRLASHSAARKLVQLTWQMEKTARKMEKTARKMDPHMKEE